MENINFQYGAVLETNAASLTQRLLGNRVKATIDLTMAPGNGSWGAELEGSAAKKTAGYYGRAFECCGTRWGDA